MSEKSKVRKTLNGIATIAVLLGATAACGTAIAWIWNIDLLLRGSGSVVAVCVIVFFTCLLLAVATGEI